MSKRPADKYLNSLKLNKYPNQGLSLSRASRDELEVTQNNTTKHPCTHTGSDPQSAKAHAPTSTSTSTNKAHNKAGAVCFRVSNIPLNWNHGMLMTTLQNIDPFLKIPSRRLSLFPAFYGSSQIALLDLEKCTEYFQQIGPDEDKYVSIEDEISETILLIDRHFYHLTPLNIVKGEPLADVVFVTGLAGHAFGSWRNRENRQMWPKDFLPEDIPEFRCLSYGYKSNLVGEAVEDGFEFLDYTRQFIHSLNNARRTSNKRPIIFVGHSMGGILILQALLQAKNGGQYRRIFDCTRAIIFFGTPHQGMDVDQIRAMVEESSPEATSRLGMVQQLQESSNFLNTQRENIISLWDSSTDSINILSFYETRKTASVGKLANGRWGRSSEKIEMVKRYSAQLFLPKEHRILVQSDHTNIVKFGLRADETYQTVVTYMMEWKNKILEHKERSERDTDHKFTEEYLKIFEFFYSENTNSRHEDIKRQRQNDTGDWFLRTENFTQWMLSDTEPIIWAYGIPGAGKTFITSRVIDHLCERANKQEYGIAYIYFNYKEQDKQAAFNVLSSLVKQLVNQLLINPTYLKDLHKKAVHQKRKPSNEELFTSLVQLSKEFTRTFVVFDALDECDQWKQREQLLPLFHQMGKAGLKIFISSRRYAEDIEESFSVVSTIRIRAHEYDIRVYINAKLNRYPSAKRMIQKTNRKEEIISELVDASDGMFLFVALNMDHICKQPTVAHMFQALKNLRNSTTEENVMDATYGRIMVGLKQQRPKSRINMAVKTLSWLARARRTLDIQELQTAVSVQPNASKLDQEYIPEETILIEICAGLVDINQESGNVRLAHFSVKDYLVRTNEIILETESMLANTCSTYLAFDIFKKGACITKEDFVYRIQSNSFFNYAASYLAPHLRSCNEDSTMEIFERFLGCDGNILAYAQVLYYNTSEGLERLNRQHTEGISRGGWYYPKKHLPQHVVARAGHKTIMKLLVERNANISAADTDNNTPLWLAVKEGNQDMVEFLFKLGADIKKEDATYNDDSSCITRGSLLNVAVQGGNKTLIQLLIDHGADINQTYWHYNNRYLIAPLHIATVEKNEAVIRLLLECNANAENYLWGRFCDCSGETKHESEGYKLTALHYAVSHPLDETILRLLLDHGAKIEARTKCEETCCNDHTVLHLAVRNKNKTAIEILLDHDAKIDAQCSGGIEYNLVTALHMAIIPKYWGIYDKRRDEIFQLILSYGANPKIGCHRGTRFCEINVLHLMASEIYDHGTPLFNILLSHGAEIEAKISFDNKPDKTALHIAAYKRNEPMIEMLLNSGADINARALDGSTPLHWASCNVRTDRNCFKSAQLLIDRGALIDARDSNGSSPLHWALHKSEYWLNRDGYDGDWFNIENEYSHENIVELLLERGAID